MPKSTNLVVIKGNQFTFYSDRTKIVSLESNDMTKEYLEYYRSNPKALLRDISSSDTVA